MFVKTNTIRAIKDYFKSRLMSFYSESEIKAIYTEVICKRMNINKVELMTGDDKYLSESDLLYFRTVVKRLLNHEPFQYVMGTTDFYGLEIKCDSRALIPRPETEELVDWIAYDNKRKENLKIVDLCTGTGCIALALKKASQNTSVVIGIDISKDAVKLAEENAAINNLDVKFEELDVLNSIQFKNQFKPASFDVWVSNPPYIPDTDKLKMNRNVLDFEPHLALFVSDQNPLIFYNQIAKQADIYLINGGHLYFEIHEDLSNGVIEILKNYNFVNIELRKDLQGKPRMIKAQKA